MSHLYAKVDTMKFIATPEQLRARLELRRSNASAKHVNKKKYNRKKKHVGKSTFWDQYEIYLCTIFIYIIYFASHWFC